MTWQPLYEISRDGATLRIGFNEAAFADLLAAQEEDSRKTNLQKSPTHGFALGPFNCEYDGVGVNAIPLRMERGPVAEFSLPLQFEVDRSAEDGLRSAVLRGHAGFKLDYTVTVTTPFSAKLTCLMSLPRIILPVTGALSGLVGGALQPKVGFEVSGNLDVARIKVGGVVEARTAVSEGVRRTSDGSYEFDGDISAPTVSIDPVLEYPSSDSQVFFRAGVKLVGEAVVSLGSPLIPQMMLNVLQVDVGLGLESSLAPDRVQILDSNPTGRTSYALNLSGEAKPGSSINAWLTAFSVPDFVPRNIKLETKLGESPTGRASATSGRYGDGDAVRIHVELDPSSTRFPSGLRYNVKDLFLLKRTDGAPEVLAQVRAEEDQTSFDFELLADGEVLARDLYAFATTNTLLGDAPRLEIGAASGVLLNATLADTIMASSPLDVRLTIPVGDGGSLPAAGRFVEIATTCGSAEPSRGVTERDGSFRAILMPASGCQDVTVVISAHTEQGGSEIANRETLRARVVNSPRVRVTGVDIWLPFRAVGPYNLSLVHQENASDAALRIATQSPLIPNWYMAKDSVALSFSSSGEYVTGGRFRISTIGCPLSQPEQGDDYMRIRPESNAPNGATSIAVQVTAMFEENASIHWTGTCSEGETVGTGPDLQESRISCGQASSPSVALPAVDRVTDHVVGTAVVFYTYLYSVCSYRGAGAIRESRAELALDFDVIPPRSRSM